MPPAEVLNSAIVASAEQKITDLLLQPGHFWMMVGIFALLYILRAIGPVGASLFSKKYNWMIPILNFGLSCLGIFVAKMTTITTMGMKFVVAVLITAVTTYGYELTKPLVKKIFGNVFGLGDEEAQKTPAKPSN